MRNGEPGLASPRGSTISNPGVTAPDVPESVIMTEISPFHCLYQDALDFHSQSRLMIARSAGSASRLARASLLLYVGAAEALVHQAAAELGRPDLSRMVADPTRPIPTLEAWRLLPAIVPGGSLAGFPDVPPWPQFAEVLEVRRSWAYPGHARERRTYYQSPRVGADFEPLEPHQVPAGLDVSAADLHFPKTGLPRDPYALRPHHLDTARGVLDAAIESLDRLLGGALIRDNRHRREPIRVVHPPARTDR